MDDQQLDAIAAATEKGISAAIANPDNWERGFDAFLGRMRGAAQQESGKWVLGWFAWLFRKFVGAVVIIGVLYYTGGLSAVTAYLKVK